MKAKGPPLGYVCTQARQGEACELLVGTLLPSKARAILLLLRNSEMMLREKVLTESRGKALTSDGALLVLMELALDEAQHQA